MSLTIRHARMMRGFTQQQMADVLCVHRTTYRKLEEHPDQITIAQAKEISRVTGVSINDLNFFAQNST